MDSLDAQIKALQRKKIKIAMLRKIQDGINDMPDSPDHEGLKDEIRAFFDGIVNQAVVAIQAGKAPAAPSLEAAAVDRGSLPPEGDDSAVPAPAPRKVKPAPQLVDFVRQYSHFGFKKISGKTLTGETVKGIVKKIDFPNLLVEVNGDLVDVDPSTASLEE